MQPPPPVYYEGLQPSSNPTAQPTDVALHDDTVITPDQQVTLADYHSERWSTQTGHEPYNYSNPSIIVSSPPYPNPGQSVQADGSYRYYGEVPQSHPQPRQHHWSNQGQESEGPVAGNWSTSGLDPQFQDAIRAADYSDPHPISPLTYLYPRGRPNVTSRVEYSQGLSSHHFIPVEPELEPRPTLNATSTSYSHLNVTVTPDAPLGVLHQPEVPKPLHSTANISNDIAHDTAQGYTPSQIVQCDEVIPKPIFAKPSLDARSLCRDEHNVRYGVCLNLSQFGLLNGALTQGRSHQPINAEATVYSFSSTANPLPADKQPPVVPTVQQTQPRKAPPSKPKPKCRRGMKWFSTEPLPADPEKVRVKHILSSTLMHGSGDKEPSVQFVNYTTDALREKYHPSSPKALSLPGPSPPPGASSGESFTSFPNSLPAYFRQKLLDPNVRRRLKEVDPRASNALTDIFKAFQEKLAHELAQTAPSVRHENQKSFKEAKASLVSWGLQYILNSMTSGLVASQEDLEVTLTQRLNSGDVFGHVCQAWRSVHMRSPESRLRSESHPTSSNRGPRSTSPLRSRPRSVSSSNLKTRLQSPAFGTDNYARHFSPEIAAEIKDHLISGLSSFLTDNVTAPFIAGMVDHALRLIVEFFPELKRFFDTTAGLDVADLINIILNIALSGCYMHFYGTKPEGVGLPFIQTEHRPHLTTQESFQVVLCLRSNTLVAENSEPYVLHFRSGGIIALFTWMIRTVRRFLPDGRNPVLERLAGQGCCPPLEKDFMDQALVLPIGVMSMALFGCFHFRSLTVTGREILDDAECRSILSRKMATAGSALSEFAKEDPLEYADLRRHLLQCVDMYSTPPPIPAPQDFAFTWTVPHAVHLNFGRPLLAHASHSALHEEDEMDDWNDDAVSTSTATATQSANLLDPYTSPIPLFDNRPSAQRHRLFEVLRPPVHDLTRHRKRRRSNSM